MSALCHAMLRGLLENLMPIGYITAMLAYSEHQYINAKRSVKAGLLGNCAAQREARDYWWKIYRQTKG